MNKTTGTLRACADSNASFTVTVTNIGTVVGKNLVVTDTLPSGFTFGTSSDTTITKNFGDINPQETKTFTYLAHIGSSVTAGKYKNTATAKIDNGGSPNNSAQATAQVTVDSDCTSLKIAKIAEEPSSFPGGEVDFTITVSNLSLATAINVTVSDDLPAGWTASDGRTAWSLGDLTPGQTKTVTLTALVPTSATEGAYVNVATAQADNHGPVSADAEVSISAGSVLGAMYPELPNTGGALARVVIYFVVNILALGAGIFLYRKTDRYAFFSN